MTFHIPSIPTQEALSEDLSKQVSQDNIAAFLVERVAKYLAYLLSVGS
jgi:hypothetical protein